MKAQPEEKQENDSPLAGKEPKVARFSRKAIFVIALIGSSILAFALVGTFAPKKKVAGQEVKNDKSKRDETSPELPDPLITGPANYGDLHKTKASSPFTIQKLLGTDTAAGQQGTPAGQAQATFPTMGQPLGVSDQRQGTAQQQNKEKEQRQKELASAATSPVTFNGGSDPAQQPAQSKAELIQAQPAGPPTFELEKITQRLAGNGGGGGVTFDDQNMQGEKRSFTNEKRDDFPYLKATILSPISPFEIKAGTILPAVLITGVNSDLPGQLVAQMRENVYDTVSGNYLLIPQGTRIIGEYDSKIAFGQERVLVVWTRLIMPNGDSISLEGMPGTDLSGYAGITGNVNNHYGKLITGVVLGSMIGAGAQVAVGGQGTALNAPSFGQLATQGAAQNINQVAQQHTSKVLNLQPTIEVQPGDKLNVFVTKDVILRPYKE